MAFDKYKSIKKGNRIPEKNLLALAFLFGAFGIFLGMKAPLYHKAGKPKFKWIIISLLIINILSVCVLKYMVHFLFT